MNKINNKYPYKDRKYDVVPYDSDWVIQFDKYASKIKSIFGDVRVEHIGSTSVPGMSGKSCIDVLVIVSDLKAIEKHISDMEQADFEYAGSFVINDSLLFRIVKNNTPLANVHFFSIGHPHIAEMLNLRNYLRTHPEEVVAYSKIKNDLYSKYAGDYASYRKYKDDYMDNLKKKVQGWFIQDASRY